jgi:hypothetical protein
MKSANPSNSLAVSRNAVQTLERHYVQYPLGSPNVFWAT